MPKTLEETDLACQSPRIECHHCSGKLPLRLSQQGELGAVWLCAECSVPFVAICMAEHLPAESSSILLDERYFDTAGLPQIDESVRREVAQLAICAAEAIANEHRRSERVSQSLVVPAVGLDGKLNPIGVSFQLMVANISREGIGLVHNQPVHSEYIALKLSLDNREPIQVIVRIVRRRKLDPPLVEIGGEFFVRLGSLVKD